MKHLRTCTRLKKYDVLRCLQYSHWFIKYAKTELAIYPYIMVVMSTNTQPRRIQTPKPRFTKDTTNKDDTLPKDLINVLFNVSIIIIIPAIDNRER